MPVGLWVALSQEIDRRFARPLKHLASDDKKLRQPIVPSVYRMDD
jgi:hypothetical protein